MGQKFTDIFIRRPVLATVVSLLIFFIGLHSIYNLQVRQFPKVDSTVITVSTAYTGAPASLIQGFITSPIEKALASADGVDYISSESSNGSSVISVNIKLGFNANEAFTNIMSKVQQVKYMLPQAAQDPIVQKSTGHQTALMYIGLSSKEMTPEQITDYVTRVMQPKLETLSGVAEAKLMGGSSYSMRIWLNTKRMAALGVSPGDVTAALQKNNFQSAAGSTKGIYTSIAVQASTDLQNQAGFANLIIKHDASNLVRLKDIARIQLGAKDYNSQVTFNGQQAVFIGIVSTPTANPLSVINNVKAELPSIFSQFPPALQGKVVYDSTKYISASIHEVLKTIFEATLIVILIIYLFLGSIRTVTVPVVTIPLSLIGVFGFMVALGYTINLLTLLSLVLAIGLVVDDAIVVVENIYRHIEDGMSAIDSAIQGAREIATPVISMTITLAAVYAPIGLMGGLTGMLFKEFAFTLAGAVIVSGIIALTLSPMMCSKLLTPAIGQQRFVRYIDLKFTQIKNRYEKTLNGILDCRPVMILFSFVVLISCFFLFVTSKAEMAPLEDQGVIFSQINGPQTATLRYIQTYTDAINKTYRSISAGANYFIVSNAGSGFAALILKPWNERTTSQSTVLRQLQAQFAKNPALQIFAFPLPSLPISGRGNSFSFVITAIRPFSEILPVMNRMVKIAQKSGLFAYISESLRFNKPQVSININRNKAAQMGISMQEISMALSSSLGGGNINYFNMEGRSYPVIAQVEQRFRYNADDLNSIYLKSSDGTMVPLSTLATMRYSTQPSSLSHFQQLNSATLQGMLNPGVSMSQAIDYLKNVAKKELPMGMSYDYSGPTRQFVKEGSVLLYTFAFSIIIIFLVLAAQFESFRDPLVIMTSVPMAICGALLPINWGLATINIYTQIGLITLIGLISKHGILMVDFANKLREAQPDLSLREAIVDAAAIRLRPILMTTAAMVLGVTPLLFSTGAGAVSRFDIGLVITSGMLIGTTFTLLVVPTMYTLKSKSILLLLLSVAATATLAYQLMQIF
jgi:multidrug efflux pump